MNCDETGLWYPDNVLRPVLRPALSEKKSPPEESAKKKEVYRIIWPNPLMDKISHMIRGNGCYRIVMKSGRDFKYFL